MFTYVFPASLAMLKFVYQILEESPSLVVLLHVRPRICGCSSAFVNGVNFFEWILHRKTVEITVYLLVVYSVFYKWICIVISIWIYTVIHIWVYSVIPAGL